MIAGELEGSKTPHFTEQPGNPEVQLSKKQKAILAKTNFGKSVKLCQRESIFITLEPVTCNTHYVERHFLILSGATATNARDNIRTTAITSKANSYLKTAMQMTTAKLAGIHAGEIGRNSNRVVVDLNTSVIPGEVTLFDFLDDYRQDAENMGETDKKIRVSMANVMEREVACRNWQLAHVSDAVRCMYPAYRLRNSEKSGLVKPPAWFCEYHDVDKWDLNEIFKLLSLLARAEVQIDTSHKVDKADKNNLKLIQELKLLLDLIASYFDMKCAQSKEKASQFREKVKDLWRDLFPAKFDKQNVKMKNGLKNFLLEINSFDKYRLWKLKSYHLLEKMASLIKDEDMKKVLSGRLLHKSESISRISSSSSSISENADYVGVHSNSDHINAIERSIIKDFLKYHRAAALITICCDMSTFAYNAFDVHDEPFQVYKMMYSELESKDESLQRKKKLSIDAGGSYDKYIKSLNAIRSHMKNGFIFTAEDIRKTRASKFMSYKLENPQHGIDHSGAILHNPSTLLFEYIHKCCGAMSVKLSFDSISEANLKEMTHLINPAFLNSINPPDSEAAWKYPPNERVFKDFIEARQECLKENSDSEKILSQECSDVIRLIHLSFKSRFIPEPIPKFEPHIISAAQNYISYLSSSEKSRNIMETEDIPLHKSVPVTL